MIDLTPQTGGPRERLLDALVEAGREHVPHAALADRAGVPAPGLTRLLAELAEAGVALETMPGRGHRLAHHAAPLDARGIESAMAGSGRWRRLVHLRAVTSTSDVAAALAESGEGDGVVVVAEAQTRGRGRGANAWFSPPWTGLWCSLLLRPRLSPEMVPALTPLAALAAIRAAREAAGVSLRVKWPNDIVAGVGGLDPDAPHVPLPWLKVGGVLAEGRTHGGSLDFAILGIGINVAPLPRGAPADVAARAASLAELAGRPIHREDLLVALLAALAPVLAVGEREGLAPFLDELRALSVLLGRSVRIAQGERVLAGVARDLDKDGALLVETPAGSIERVVAGDAHLMEGR
jgi:BirA family biotin operon repressor/biotin-[acetyl-CoA-carboxylase] ligase